MSSPTFNVQRIAIIGAGPSGLAAAKCLQGRAVFDEVVIFEQQAEVGGVWNYRFAVPASNPIPQTSPFYPPDSPVCLDPNGPPAFPSPMYDDLHANIPKSLMCFSDEAFPDESHVFPSRLDIQRHIVTYARDIRHLIRFCTQVTHVQRSNSRWHIQACSTVDNVLTSLTFDAVIVANGHYSTPFVPEISNIAAFHAAHPSIIIHSRNYHSPTSFHSKKTIVVGNGPSGLDIAAQINRHSKHRTLLSVRHPTPPDKLAHIGCRQVGEIIAFLPQSRGVRFKDGSTEIDVDAIVFCTGFRYSLPFLPSQYLLTTGTCIHGLYKHIFDLEHPTLAFIALNMRVVPFPFAETQAAVVAAVWANHLALPSTEDMRRWNRHAEDAAGDRLHEFPPLADGAYMNEMHDWVGRAVPRVGKEPPRWGDEQFWLRGVIADAKMEFERRGGTATTLEELGFVYEPKGEDASP